MSGNFLQRGEPAFVDKWARTQMALQNGVDVVFELPYAFATANAPSFAKGAIQLLDAAQCSAFCFGSEDGEIEPLERSFQLIQQAGEHYEQLIKDATRRGLSYPKALNEAYVATANTSAINGTLADLSKPNNILGFHYMESAYAIGSTMTATTIPRIVAQYHDDAIAGNQIASATGIRKAFLNRTHSKPLPISCQVRHKTFCTANNPLAVGQHFIPICVSRFYGMVPNA